MNSNEKSELILYGASGHAKVVADICEQNSKHISLILDDNPAIQSLLEYKVKLPSPELYSGQHFIISIGDSKTRKKIVEENDFMYTHAIHPSAIIDTSSEVGEGTVVMAGVVINSSVILGKHCIINTSASVDHDCHLKDYVHISPNATLCGGVSVGEGTQVGAGAVVIPNIKIGKWCTIGAGSVVVRDIPDGAKVVGNPGRVIKSNLIDNSNDAG